jgi:hypothetical protein
MHEVFDYVLRDGSSFHNSRGGRRKRDALLLGRISEVQFQYSNLGDPQPSFHEPLRAIISTITETFRVRYESRPPEKDYETLDIVRKLLFEPSSEKIRDVLKTAIEHSIVSKYEKRILRMVNHDWVIEKISHKLMIDGWPQHDKSEIQEIHYADEL